MHMKTMARIFCPFCAVLGALVCAASAIAQTSYPAAEKFTLDAVLSSPFPSELTASAKGSRIAWVFNAQGRRNIWVAEGPRFAARQLTSYQRDDGQEITDLRFSPDGATLVYVRGGNRNAAGEAPNPTSETGGAEQAVWAVGWTAGSAPRKIDAGRSPAVGAGGVAYLKENRLWLAPLPGAGKPRQIIVRGQQGAPVWSPDGKRLAFVSNRTTHSFIVVYDTRKKSLAYVAPSVDRDSTPRWSPDGKSIAFIRQPARAGGPGPGGSPLVQLDSANPWAVWTADLATGAAGQIWRSGDRPEDNQPNIAGAWILQWPVSDRIVFASEMDGWMHLYAIRVGGGQPDLLTPGGCEFEQASLGAGGKEIFFSSNCGDIDRRHLSRVSVSGGPPQAVTSGEGLEWLPIPSADGKSLAYLGSSARQPAMPFVRALGATSGEPRMLAPQMLPKDFPSARLVVPEQVVLESPDGLKIHSQLFLPPDARPGDKRPAMIFMHGGPMRHMMLGWHNRGYYHRAYGFNQYLASRGYVVVSVNFRSGIGYGRAFRMAENRGARGASEYQDIVAAGKYLAARSDVDPARVGLWGGSYGGYLTAMGLARNSELFSAGVDLHGVHDWSTRDITAAGLSPERARVAREASPVASVEKWRSPVFLVHGDDDRNVNFGQTTDLVARLRRQGVVFEQMVFPDEVHDFLLHTNWLKIYKASADFLERYLK